MTEADEVTAAAHTVAESMADCQTAGGEANRNIYTFAEFAAQGRAWTLNVVLVELRKVRVDDNEAPC